MNPTADAENCFIMSIKYASKGLVEIDESEELILQSGEGKQYDTSILIDPSERHGFTS